MIVADASPLIVLAKLQHLGLLDQALYGEVLMGSVVKAETIDAGRAVHALGVEQLEVAMADGWLQTVRLTVEELELTATSDGTLPAGSRGSRGHRARECAGPATDCRRQGGPERGRGFRSRTRGHCGDVVGSVLATAPWLGRIGGHASRSLVKSCGSPQPSWRKY